MTQPFDFIAVGLGPFNLGLACLSEPLSDLNGIVLDQNPGFDWHPGMMLQNATLQTPFLADLVTLADPTHPLSFLNYIKQQGRIYSFYIRESFFLMRREYNQYCQWVCSQLSNIRFNTRVEYVEYDNETGLYRVECKDVISGESKVMLAKKLVLGTGPAPWIPPQCEGLADKAIHSSRYLDTKAELVKEKAITIVGAGQSAAEIFYDLLQDIDNHDYQLNWVTRTARFQPLEYTKLTLEMTSPEYVDYFHDLPAAKRDELIKSQTTLYKGINSSLINEIFDLLYIKNLEGKARVSLQTNCEVKQANLSNDGVELELFHHEQQKAFVQNTGKVVFSTGYQYQPPEFLAGINDRIARDDKGRFAVARNYAIDKVGNEIYVQNAELHTHGFVTPDLGMACYRNAWLIREMTGVEHYPIEQRIAFQQFGVAEGDNACAQKQEAAVTA